MKKISFKNIIMRLGVGIGIAGLFFCRAGAAPAQGGDEAPVVLGRLDPFWRYNPLLGPYLEDGRWLVKIPDYLLRGGFPYKKRPYPLEVPFAGEPVCAAGAAGAVRVIDTAECGS